MSFISPNKLGGGRVSSGGVKTVPKGKGKGRDKEKPEPNSNQNPDELTNKDLVKGLALAGVGTYEATTEGITNTLKELEKGTFPSEERDRNKNKNLNVFEAKIKKDEEKKKKKDEEKKKK